LAREQNEERAAELGLAKSPEKYKNKEAEAKKIPN